MSDHYLITGGAGFIGHHLVRRALELGHKVRVVDNFSTGHMDRLLPYQSDIELVIGDVQDPALSGAMMHGITHVLHQAALGSVPRSVEDPVGSDDANTRGTLQLLEAARHAGTVENFVYASSSAVYGGGVNGGCYETQPLRPRSPYAATKAVCDHYARAFYQCYGLRTTGLRYFNVFGPGQSINGPYAAVIPKFITAALRGETLEVHGDGRQCRDFTFVDNVVNANFLAANKPTTAVNAFGTAFNVGTGEAYELLGMIDILSAIMGRTLEYNFVPARTGDVRSSCASPHAAMSILEYKAEVKLREGLERTVEWYKAQ